MRRRGSSGNDGRSARLGVGPDGDTSGPRLGAQEWTLGLGAHELSDDGRWWQAKRVRVGQAARAVLEVNGAIRWGGLGGGLAAGLEPRRIGRAYFASQTDIAPGAHRMGQCRHE